MSRQKHINITLLLLLLNACLYSQTRRLTAPVIDTVIIIETPECPGCLKLTWNHIPGTEFYEILKYKPNDLNGNPSSYPDGNSQVTEPFFIDINSNASTTQEKFVIIARNSIYDSIRDSEWSDPAYSLYLNEIEYDSCNTILNLKWVGKNISNSDNWYKIYKSINNSVFSLIDSTQGTEYSDIDLNENTTYAYQIRQSGTNGYFSNSNSRSKHISSLLIPDSGKQNLYAIIPSGGGISIYSKVDSTIAITSYDLFSSANPVNNFKLIRQNIPNGSSQTVFNTGNTSPSLWYRFSTNNICGVYTDTSNTMRPVELTHTQNGNSVTLQWHSAFNNPLSEEFYLLTISEGQIVSEDQIDNSGNTTVIDLGTLGNSNNESFQFQIKNINDKGYTVLSNAISVYKSVFLNIPEAFTPNGDGLNDNIGPFQNYIENADTHKFSSFLFKVIDKYGGVVYKSNDPDEEWDGTKSGSQLSEGPYYYILDFTTGEGQKIESNGFIEIVYP